MEPQPLSESQQETLSVFAEARKPWTTPEVADRLDLGRRTTYARLERLVERDQLETKKVGANARVWWRPPTTTDAATNDGAGDRRSHQVSSREQQFRSLVEAVEEYAIFMLDTEGYVRTWNPGAERIKGYEAEEILGEHFSTFYTDADREAGVPAANLKAAATEDWIEDEGWRVRKDGSRFWANVTITAIRDGDGTLTGYAKVTRDMTDRRERERQLREQHAFVESLLDAQPDILYSFDTDGDILRVNDRFQEVTGYTETEIEEMHPVEFIADRAAEDVMAALEQVLDHGEQVTVELPLLTADGEEIPYEFTGTPLTDEAGEIVGLTGVGRDISDRQARERQLERQRDDLRDELEEVFTRIDEAFFALDAEDWRITYVNDQAADLVRLPVGELMGARVWDVLPELGEDTKQIAERAVEIQDSVEFEYYSELLDVWLEIRVYPSETGLSVYVRDVTERKEREHELERTRDLLESTERIADVGGWEIDTATRDVFWTDYLFELLGIDAETEPPLEDALDYHEADRPLVEDAVETALDTGEPFDVEARFRRPDGEVRWLRIRGTPTIEDGEVVTLRGSAQDVTERKERERELEESRRRYQTLVENFQNGAVALVDEEVRYQIAGGAPVDVAADTGDDLEGAYIREAISAELADILEPRYRAALAGESSTFEEEHGGKHSRFHVFPVRDDEGEVFAAMGMSQDITERKERERELERQRERLAALNDLNGVVREITDAVIDQSTREEIETIVCERLAAASPYEFAWIGEVDPQTASISPRVEAGIDGYAEEIPLSTDPDDPTGRGPGGEAIRTREMQVNQDALTDPDFEPWCEYAQKYGYRSSAAIPIVHEDTLYGLLGVYAGRPGAFDGEEGEILAQLGEVIGHAIAAIERKRALTSDEVTEIEFTAPDFFESMGLGSDTPGTITFERMVPIGDDEFLEYGTVDEAGRPTLEAFVEAHPDIERVELVERGAETDRFELRASAPPVVSAIASAGGYMQDVQIEDGDLYMTIHLPPTVATRRIVDTVQEAFPTAELLTQRQLTRSEHSLARVYRTVTEALTDRQRAVLETAVYSGFFEWPRGSSGEEVAESLDIAPSTFSQHLRKAQQKVFYSVFQSPAQA